MKICTYNCKNIETSVQEIVALCSEHDIILLQETWLRDFELGRLSTIHDEFYAFGISSIDSSTGITKGRPYGGIAILWKKTSLYNYKILEYDQRILGIQLDCNGTEVVILNVYLPYCSAENQNDFEFYLAKLSSIIEELQTPFVYIMGDWNADVSKVNGKIRHKFGDILSHFCHAENLIVSDFIYLRQNDYTYCSAQDTTSWIDHVITTEIGHSLIQRISVLYEYITSDHHPMSVVIECNVQSIDMVEANINKSSNIRWKQLTEEDLDIYKANTCEALEKSSFKS